MRSLPEGLPPATSQRPTRSGAVWDILFRGSGGEIVMDSREARPVWTFSRPTPIISASAGAAPGRGVEPQIMPDLSPLSARRRHKDECRSACAIATRWIGRRRLIRDFGNVAGSNPTGAVTTS